MSKICPDCGEVLPDEAHFCGNCGYDFVMNENSKISSNLSQFNFKIFLTIIVISAIIIAGAFMLAGSGDNDSPADRTDSSDEVDLTITEVNGYSTSSVSPKSYSLYTEAIFNKVPSDLNGYNVRTAYMDENGTEIGFETEKLSNVYYDTDYSISFGYYTTYKKPVADSVSVEIIKDGNTVDTFTQKIDQGKIKFLN